MPLCRAAIIVPATLLTLTLAACGEQSASAPRPKAIALEDAAPRQARADPSPDTANGVWRVAPDGQAIHFAEPGEAPWLTLACVIDASPPGFTIIRHAQAYPGQSALFAFVGNGMRSRFLADASLHQTGDGGEWRWEARLAASDPQLDIFAGPREMSATLPGRGMLEIAGSRIPGEFLAWCRAGGHPAKIEPNAEAGIIAADEG